MTRLLRTALLCGLLLGPWGTCALAASPKTELKDVRERIGTLKKEVKNTEAARDDAADALKESEAAISDINRKLHRLSLQEDEIQDKLARLERQSGRTQGDLEKRQRLLGQLLLQQYRSGGQDSLKILLNQEDPNRIARHLHYYGYLYRAHATLIQRLRTDLDKLEDLADDTRERQAELAEVKAEQTKQKQLLTERRKEREAVLQRLSRKIESQRSELGRLQRDEQRLTQLMERLERQSRAAEKPATKGKDRSTAKPAPGGRVAEPDFSASPFRQHKGQLPMPVRGEVAGRFGSPREDTGAVWKGLFIRAREGEVVKSVAAGKVVFADWLRGFGNLIIVDHGSGFMSLYGSNESLYKQPGETVKAGETIATVGNSGGNPQSGLYFELRYQSKPVNPLGWLSASR